VFKEFVDTCISLVGEGAMLVYIVAAIIAILAMFVSMGGAFPVIAIFVGAILQLGQAGAQAIFTSQFWEEFKCTLFLALSQDGQFTSTGYSCLWNILENKTGSAWTLIKPIIALVGMQGLNNMASSNVPSYSACGSCGTSPCSSESPIIVTFDNFNYQEYSAHDGTCNGEVLVGDHREDGSCNATAAIVVNDLTVTTLTWDMKHSENNDHNYLRTRCWMFDANMNQLYYYDFDFQQIVIGEWRTMTVSMNVSNVRYVWIHCATPGSFGEGQNNYLDNVLIYFS
jgi:hypothetical protein